MAHNVHSLLVILLCRILTEIGLCFYTLAHGISHTTCHTVYTRILVLGHETFVFRTFCGGIRVPPTGSPGVVARSSAISSSRRSWHPWCRSRSRGFLFSAEVRLALGCSWVWLASIALGGAPPRGMAPVLVRRPPVMARTLTPAAFFKNVDFTLSSSLRLSDICYFGNLKKIVCVKIKTEIAWVIRRTIHIPVGLL